MKKLSIVHFKTVASNTSSQLVIKFITSGITLLVTFLISFYIGLSEFGSFSKVITFVSLFYLVVDFGMNAQFIKEYYENPEKHILKLLLTRLGISIVLLVIAVTIAFLLPYNGISNIGYSSTEKLGILLFSFTITTFGFSLSLQSILQRRLKYSILIIPNVVSAIVVLIGVAIGIQLENLLLVILSFVISQFVMGAILFLIVQNKFHISYDFSGIVLFAKRLIQLSWPLGVILFFNLIYAKSDIIILAFFKPSFDVGIYGFAYRIFEFCIAIPAFVANSLYPILLANKNNNTVFFQLIKRYSLLLFGGSLIISIMLILFAPLLSFFKNDYSYIVTPLRILALSLPFFFITGLLQWVFIVHGKKLQLFFLYLFALIFNISLNIIFIPKYSYLGASWITLFSEGIVLCIMIGLLMRQKNYS